MADWEQLQTPERIRYTKATAAADRASARYREAETEYHLATEAFRAALAEKLHALRALNQSMKDRK